MVGEVAVRARATPDLTLQATAYMTDIVQQLNTPCITWQVMAIVARS